MNAVLLKTEGKIATITISRPHVLNAVNFDVLDQLEETVDTLARDNSISVVIITGAGDKAFMVGTDLHLMLGYDGISVMEFIRRLQGIWNKIEALNKVVIAAVNGYALGGGCELALVCDIRVATEKGKFGLPEVSLGMIPGCGGTQRLPRLIGVGRAKEMMFTGKPITAQRALEIGLVNHVVEEERLMDFCRELAETIAANSPIAMSFCKAAIDEGFQMDLMKGIAHEAALFSVNYNSADRLEGVQAFMEKRKAKFKGFEG